jgi:hypothetical protein
MNAVNIAITKKYRKRDISDLVGGALDQPIAVTRFPNAAALRKRTREMSMRELRDEIRDTAADDKARLPWFKLGRFGGDRTDKGCLRSDANVEAVTGLEADYDGEAITINEAASRLREARVAALLYSTPSSTAERPRWRAFLPFADEHRPEARTGFMERLNAIFEGEIDGASFTLSQSYYGGNVEGRPPIMTRLVDGDFIDMVRGLDRLPKGRRRDGETTRHALDESRSGEAFRLATEIKNQGGGSFAKFESALADDPELAAWAKDKRQVERAWERAPDIAAEFEDIPADEREPRRKQQGLSFLSPADCATRVEREYVVKGMLARGDVGCIVGAPGVGKSLLSPHLGYMVAQGRPTFGMRTRPGKVFYVAAEDEHGMRNRVTALRKRHGDANGFTLVGGVSDLLTKGSRNLKELAVAVERERPALIFIDTLAMAFPGLEENTAEGMGRVVGVARFLGQWGASVILVHHDTKDGQQGLPRGHSLLNGALDMSIHLVKDDDGIVRGRLTKNRNGPCDKNLAFKIDSVELGIDSDGDPVTAGLCGELDSAHAATGSRLTPSARAALDTLARLASTQKRVTENEWREECVSGREVSAADTHDGRRRAFKRAVVELVQTKRVIFKDQFCRVANPFDEFEDENEGRYGTA